MSFKKDLLLLLKPYYWVNILMSISYIVAKRAPFICNYLWTYLFGQEDQCELDGRETEILFFLIIVVMVRTRKTGSVTMINYLTSSFMYTKIANLGLWFYNDIRLGMIYFVFFILVALLLPEPTYTGPENVLYFRTENALDEELEKDKRVTWLVTFYTVWNPACVNFAPIFSELSNEYSLQNLKFGKLDIGRFPKVGQKYHVSDSSFSRQLPTVILFRQGKEVVRRPFADSKGKLVKFFFSADNVKAAFDLNNLFKECKDNPIKAIKSVTEKKKD
ncbi:thioredoxin-related transmembrane protein 2 homolog [Anopheles ziemanni]|uniref:thioredoxin-related transmembrane protein 2 homolog n=1 Tax=Anopheles coustani TaxID=139045 RepID=UPI00265AB565|nr:thioredoxin-related transmembrane protein 2 homolog [Anopheles coustani]XP_058178963.1 thioredoxin-related transmembrane protein 2 homolog [Anopheles ziemanni]